MLIFIDFLHAIFLLYFYVFQVIMEKNVPPRGDDAHKGIEKAHEGTNSVHDDGS